MYLLCHEPVRALVHFGVVDPDPTEDSERLEHRYVRLVKLLPVPLNMGCWQIIFQQRDRRLSISLFFYFFIYYYLNKYVGMVRLPSVFF